MAEVEITIGGRNFIVACQDGEEHYLRAAAAQLDAEAQALTGQVGRLPESRLLLMAGLLVADRTAGLEEDLRRAEERIAALEAQLAELQDRPAPEPQSVEVAVIPDAVADMMAELAARAEAVAAQAEEVLLGGGEETAADHG